MTETSSLIHLIPSRTSKTSNEYEYYIKYEFEIFIFKSDIFNIFNLCYGNSFTMW